MRNTPVPMVTEAMVDAAVKKWLEIGGWGSASGRHREMMHQLIVAALWAQVAPGQTSATPLGPDDVVVRQQALSLAHDCNRGPQEVVDRAAVYYGWLTGSEA